MKKQNFEFYQGEFTCNQENCWFVYNSNSNKSYSFTLKYKNIYYDLDSSDNETELIFETKKFGYQKYNFSVYFPVPSSRKEARNLVLKLRKLKNFS